MSYGRFNTWRSLDNTKEINIGDVATAASVQAITGAINLGFVKTVNTVADLKGLSKTVYKTVTTLGFYNVYDKGGATYALDPLDTSSSERGGTIVAADGGRWKIVNSQSLNVRQIGCVANGTTDDSAKIAAAYAEASPRNITIPEGLSVLIDSALTVPKNCGLIGPHAYVGTPGGNTANNYLTVGGALIVNPSVSITLASGANVRGVLAYRKGMTFPADTPAAFAGTCFVSAGDDNSISNSMILGFNMAYSLFNYQRPRIWDSYVDCQNGFDIGSCYDIPYFRNVHCWPFVTIASTNKPTDGSWAHRGTGFYFHDVVDWGKCDSCFTYGYARGFDINNANSMTLLSCGTDHTGLMNSSIGIFVRGTSQDTAIVACETAAQGSGVTINTSDNLHTQVIGHRAWACVNHGSTVVSGDASFVGGTFRNSPNGISVASATSNVLVEGVRLENNSVYHINPTVTTSNLALGRNQYVGSTVLTNSGIISPRLASASNVVAPANGEVVRITGSTAMNTMTGGYEGKRVLFVFDQAVTVAHSTSGNGFALNGAANFVAASGSTLGVVFDGTRWIEVSRKT